MILFEGPDGAGKTSLINRLVSELKLPRAGRACTSEGGPVDDLFAWAWVDINSWRDQTFIKAYDRHPLVSEYVYGPVIRGQAAEGFHSQAAADMRKYLEAHTFTVFCMPPLDVIETNLRVSKQMRGVDEHIEEIYMAYMKMIPNWKGPFMIWDYTAHNSHLIYKSLVGILKDYMNTREEIR